MRSSRTYRIIAALSIFGTLIACTPQSTEPGKGAASSGNTGSDASPQPSKSVDTEPAGPDPAEVERVTREAQRLRAQYDYDAAIKLLEGVETGETRALIAEIQEETSGLAAYEEPETIPHIFFHSLVVDTARAFDGDSKQQGYLDYMVTQYEFERILDELYKRDFVLVTPNQFAKINKNGKMKYRSLKLPEGKKPIVISVDDVSYYEYMDGDGFATKLVIDDGKIRNEYVTSGGETLIGAYDVPTVLDDFVEEHPDFSYRGAKGMLALTGYNGVFGYRTSKDQYPDNKDLDKDIEQATKIANLLKDTGWVMASHSWGHLSVGRAKFDRLQWDTKMWHDEVEPILGSTPHFIYPFGSDIASVQQYSGQRFELLKRYGFDYYYGVDGTARAWHQKGKDYIRQARINIDGLQFAKQRRGDRPVLEYFFDVEKVIDPAREKVSAH